MTKSRIIRNFYNDVNNKHVKTITNTSVVSVFSNDDYLGCTIFENESDVIKFILQLYKKSHKKAKYKIIRV